MAQTSAHIHKPYRTSERHGFSLGDFLIMPDSMMTVFWVITVEKYTDKTSSDVFGSIY